MKCIQLLKTENQNCFVFSGNFVVIKCFLKNVKEFNIEPFTLFIEFSYINYLLHETNQVCNSVFISRLNES